MAVEKIAVRCCIAGGGPAGIMAGFLLARAGIDVVVLEKHADFLRDFRGDTIHPSTLEVMHELGIDGELLKLPHEKVDRLGFSVGDQTLAIADMSYVPARHPFIAFMPQWDFLNFLADKGDDYPGFKLLMNTEVNGLIEKSGRVAGVRAKGPAGELEIACDLVLGADGRHSTVREQAGLEILDIGAPIDVLWFRITRTRNHPPGTMGRIGAGAFLALINRGDYWQCGFVIPKGASEKVRERGLPAFRRQLAEIMPFARQEVEELKDWDQIKLLTVAIDRLKQWYRPGLLCIGDSAHAMSPVGGVGINLAIQDAVAAANILAGPIREDRLDVEHLRAVQARREFPTRLTQRLQVLVQNRVINPVLSGKELPKPPLALRLFNRFPWLRRIPAYMVGIGVRPEHVRTPKAPPLPKKQIQKNA
jgi:2-polyprenyl-6-methoxyphenol hydroxylase-like FAD-dependent oxidoreductase